MLKCYRISYGIDLVRLSSNWWTSMRLISVLVPGAVIPPSVEYYVEMDVWCDIEGYEMDCRVDDLNISVSN